MKVAYTEVLEICIELNVHFSAIHLLLIFAGTMQPHWVHEKIQRKLTVVIRVVKSHVDLEHEAVGLRDRAQGLQGDRGQIEREVEPLHRVPG